MATVHVLPEVNLPSHPEGALWSCYHKFGCQATTSGMLEKPYQATSGKNRLGRAKHKKVGFLLFSFFMVKQPELSNFPFGFQLFC